MKRQSKLGLLAPLFLTLACQPNHKDSSQPVGYQDKVIVPAATTPQQMNCFDQIKSKMMKADFRFSEVSNAQFKSELAKMAPLPSAFSKATYNLSHATSADIVTSIGVDHEAKEGDANIKYSLSLSVPDKDSKQLFTLILAYTRSDASGLYSEWDQKYRVEADCRLTLVQTTLDSTRMTNQKITGQHLEEYTDNRAGSFRTSLVNLQVPPENQFKDFSNEKIDNWEQAATFIKNNLASKNFCQRSATSPYYLCAQLEIGADIQHFDPQINQQTQFHSLSMRLDQLGEINSYYSDQSDFNFTFFSKGDSENWHVNAELFQKAQLSRIEEQNLRTFEVSQQALASGEQVHAEFLTSEEFKYPNLASYWSVEKQEEANGPSNNYKIKYLLQSRPITAQNQESDGLVTDSKEFESRPELQESKAVQVSNPTIQSYVAELKKRSSLNRLEMARMIGQLMPSLLTYDYKSVSDGSLHALTTAEILERKLGVCQHFANVFAPLARGVGIPTRIITGFYLSPTGVGAHAWNEIELRPNVWVPIEPQSPSLSLNPISYLPILSGGYLETMDNATSIQGGLSLMIQFKGRVLEETR